MHLMLEGVTDVDQRQQLLDELTGPLRTMSDRPMTDDERNAPSWWHGDEEAYTSTMAALQRTPRRRRR